MLKSVLTASAALAIALSPLCVAAPASAGKVVPLLSGKYLWMSSTFCQAIQTAKGINIDMSRAVASVALNNSANELQSGTGNFIQGGTPDSGSLTLAVTDDQGSPFVEAGQLGSGNNSEPLNQSVQNLTIPFTQTFTTLSVTVSSQQETYNVYYGKLINGIAQSAVFGGIDHEGCAKQVMLTHV